MSDGSPPTDITIVGAGPAGLTAAFWAGMRRATVRLVDSLAAPGGQLTALYPGKPIYDVPGYPRILARDLVRALHRQGIEAFGFPIDLDTVAESVAYEGGGEDRVVVLRTSRGELRSRTLIIAGGHGAFQPRGLPELDLREWEGRGLHSVVRDLSDFAGRRVVIVGGGDSACDWALGLLEVAASVVLVHRRDEFRAHEHTVEQLRKAERAGRLEVLTPHRITELRGNGRIEQVVLGGERDLVLDADTVLLQLGFRTSLGPLADWGLELDRSSIVVGPTMGTNLERIWACGDITAFEGKIKLIATGFGEAAMAVAQAIRTIRPETRLQPGFSTNTGVPGVVAGER